MTHPKPDPNCEDCKGSGQIEVESVRAGRTRYDKEARGLVIDCEGLGDWHMAQCPCVGEWE